MSEQSDTAELELELASKAQKDFDSGNLDKCQTILTKLASLGHAHDPQLLHNTAVVEFYKSKCTKTEEFKIALTDALAKSNINVETMTGLDDLDQTVMCYNMAVLCYYMRQYRRGLLITEKLLQFIEPMDEVMARRVIFLMAELCMATQQRALGILGYAEKNTLSAVGKSGGQEGKESEVGEAWRPRAGVYKATCHMMLQSLKSCKRELKSLVTVTTMTVPVIYLKAHFEFLRGNYRKAIKVIAGAAASKQTPGVAQTGEALPVMHCNNMAVLHLHIKKPHLAVFYLRRALYEDQRMAASYDKQDTGKPGGRPLAVVGVSRHYELLYNLGVCLLHASQPGTAFEVLIDTIQVYSLNPRLWLRLAECCIMAHQASNEEDRKLCNRLKVIQGSVGSGVHRKLILGSGLQCHKSGQTGSAAIPVSSLEFASLCLQNALTLLPEEGSMAPDPSPDPLHSPEHRPEVQLVAAPPSSPLRPSEVDKLRCSVLASLAYVSLCLHDHILTLQYATRLLRQTRISGAHRYLAHMYLAEAQVATDKIADAISNLNPDAVTDVSPAGPETRVHDTVSDKNGDSQDGQEVNVMGVQYPWSPGDVQQARGYMLHNLATAHTMRGEYEKALLHLAKSISIVGTPLPAQMFFLKLYLELMEGRKKTVHHIIKEHFGHVTPNRM